MTLLEDRYSLLKIKVLWWWHSSLKEAYYGFHPCVQGLNLHNYCEAKSVSHVAYQWVGPRKLYRVLDVVRTPLIPFYLEQKKKSNFSPNVKRKKKIDQSSPLIYLSFSKCFVSFYTQQLGFSIVQEPNTNRVHVQSGCYTCF